jgi:hypothetical protein
VKQLERGDAGSKLFPRDVDRGQGFGLGHPAR